MFFFKAKKFRHYKYININNVNYLSKYMSSYSLRIFTKVCYIHSFWDSVVGLELMLLLLNKFTTNLFFILLLKSVYLRLFVYSLSIFESNILFNILARYNQIIYIYSNPVRPDLLISY